MSPPLDREQAAYWRGAYEQRRALREVLARQLEGMRQTYRAAARKMGGAGLYAQTIWGRPQLAQIKALDYALTLMDTVRPPPLLAQPPLPLPKPARRRRHNPPPMLCHAGCDYCKGSL